ncbi:hypothetical protein OG239_09495 [Streptomyces sp. NBC_00868]|uniref:hypothetical protein n=1 Tax=unclassified Streptomyces TaxID=2593676 RepID=UPI00324D2EB2|nr:hypothetical protein OG239_09495 [Streptomyces sp. NBC_00868]
MFVSSARSAAVLAVALAAFAVSCGTEPAAPAAGPAAAPSASAAPAAGTSTAPGSTAPGSAVAPSSSAVPAEKVRDAFAGLQATLNDSCTPGNCAYFLGRVHDELHRVDRAMKTDPKGPGHFPEPIDLIAQLDKELGGDRSFENLKKHQASLIGTRDKINTWMQGHPDDYR